MTLIRDWSRHDAVPSGLVFRVAVRQVESCLLADRESMAALLGVNARQLPANPENLPDAKRFLLQLANEAPRRVRDELLAPQGAVARQGLGYNALLSDFVRLKWKSDRAAIRSDSLKRARKRLSELAANH